MRTLDDAPRWPPVAGVVALAGAYVVALVVVTILAIVAEAVGYEPESVPPGAVLAVAVLFAGAAVAACVVVARQTAPPTPAQFGLRPAPAVESALLVAAAAVIFGVVAWLWAWSTVERLALPIPGELDGRSALDAVSGIPTPVADVDPGGALAASALARAVVAPVAAQVVLLGFVLPALSRWRGVVPAAVVCAIGLALASSVVGDSGRLLVPALVLGALLVGLRLRTGSLLPGIVLGCGAAGTALGDAVRFEPPGAVALGVACALVGLALVLPLARR